MGEERQVREKPEQLARGRTEGDLVKEPRGSVGGGRRREAVENRAEEASQDELAVLSRQRSAEGSSEGSPIKMSWHS